MFRQYSSSAAAALALPTTNLFAQFDASDVAQHNTGTGVWTPSAGSSSDTITAKSSVGGSTTTFGYSATPQNGLPVIVAHGSKCFQYTSADNTTDYPDGNTFLLAFRIASGSSGSEVFRCRFGASASYIRVYFPSADTLRWHVPGVSNPLQTFSAGIDDADGAFRIISAGIKNGEGGFIATSNPDDNIVNMADHTDNLRIRGALTAFFVDMDFDVCELLIYTKMSGGASARAMEYLRQKWNP